MKNQQSNIVAIDINAVKSRILEIRNQQVLLDRDVAALYGVETRVINQAVKNNPEKFPNGYVVELSSDEFATLRSKFLTANISSKSRALPKVFTEKGLYMLATISASLSTPYEGSGRWVATLAAMKPRRRGRDFRVG